MGFVAASACTAVGMAVALRRGRAEGATGAALAARLAPFALLDGVLVLGLVAYLVLRG